MTEETLKCFPKLYKWNTPLPMLVTLLGITTDAREEHKWYLHFTLYQPVIY